MHIVKILEITAIVIAVTKSNLKKKEGACVAKKSL